MAVTNRKHRRHWLKWLAAGFLLLIGLLLAAGMIYESAASAAARRNFPPPGQLVDVGGYRLHLRVMGEDQGRPTVILDHGGASMSAQWGWVQPALAQQTQVVAYDRPGMGWSDPSPTQLEAAAMVAHLYSALQQLGISGPYILVGHSMGGLMIRVFAKVYPEEVSALILVDPRDTSQEGIFEPAEADMSPAALTLISTAGRLGVVRLAGIAAQDAHGLPPRQFDEAVAITPAYHHLRHLRSEGYLGNSAAAYLLAGEMLESIPLVVLSGTEADGAFDARQREALLQRHAQIASLSAQGRHELVPGAGHVTIVTNPEYAESITRAVLSLLEAPVARATTE
jgi:pimeloyl-ACP methyl ester carboxylesterase